MTLSSNVLWLAGRAQYGIVLLVSILFHLQSAHAAPANDHLANRIVLSGSPVSTTGTNVASTGETGEPFHGPDDTAVKSVWWSWTAPTSGLYTMSTAGSSYDTLLAVYTGTAFGGLTLVVRNDDKDGFDTTSFVSFQATAGVTYQIAVDGAFALVGQISLAIDGPFFPPANDQFADRTALTSGPQIVAATTSLATRQVGEPFHGNLTSGERSVWWSWTAPVTGRVTFTSSGGNFLATLGLYTGTALDALTVVPVQRQSIGVTCEILASVTAGVTYAIAADNDFGFSGPFNLTVGGVIPVPANDNFVGRFVALENQIQSGTTVNASSEAGESVEPFFSQGNSVWWTWTAPSSGRWLIDASGSAIQPHVGLYSGSNVSSLIQVARTTWLGAALPNTLVFNASAGEVFQIAISSLGEIFSSSDIEGDVSFIIEPSGAAPSNDAFAASRRIFTSGSFIGDNFGALTGRETGELQMDDGGLEDIGGNSVWWKWTAPSGVSIVTFDTFGSDFDTVLGVYTGAGLGSLTEVAVNDESSSVFGQSEVVFTAVPGQTYHIAVNGFLGEQGNIQLNFTGGGVLTNDDFVNAIDLGSAATATGSVELSVLFGTENGEPDAGTELEPAKTAWWTWAAPSSGIVRVDTLESNFDTVLHVYTGGSVSALTLVQSNHDSDAQGRSRLFFEARAGQIYHLRVRGESSLDVGMVELKLQIQPTPVAFIDVETEGQFCSFSFARYLSRDGIVYVVAVSDDLLNWDKTGAQVELIGSPVPMPDGLMEMVTCRVKQALLPADHKFMRLEITEATP
jgi:hypothetical protein